MLLRRDGIWLKHCMGCGQNLNFFEAQPSEILSFKVYSTAFGGVFSDITASYTDHSPQKIMNMISP